ncbi:helix-turn-helix transcriptional regulator [Tumebacillus sp. DT12]|uniref:Helix-turn-helix transcriptional regulator n=1 Tax=Tumebacillus lacus TaxID=2995335 RepID=A0ABT3X0D3_9BACL|nr:helix-turn-helix transcriptional regulator [Tumebacillus lacus]MCX7570358.1 helix-turn-helix transcriptional regulator [Tumebacillus lacus]
MNQAHTNRLLEIRNNRQWTVQEAADFYGLYKSTYANYEYGRRKIPSHTLLAMAEKLNVTAEYILGEDDDPATKILKLLKVAQISMEDEEEIAKILNKYKK